MARAKKPRGFKEVTVGNCVSQQGYERYAEPWEELETERLAELLDDYGEQLPPPEWSFCEGAPNIAPWRSNLVALSQRFNLYFAAYQTQVHITIPRNVKQTLPPQSDMIVLPPRSDKARKTRGYIDNFRPHCVNHMIIGNLGDHEVLLIACDDGDVIAYYTHLVMQDYEDYKSTGADSFNGRTPFCSTSPFFHENVGISAWGLSIHDKSRLIAVGSNLREVTVFAFALNSQTEGLDNACEETACSETEIFPASTCIKKDDNGTVERNHNFRRVLALGPHGHNVPSITFSSNNGKAESVIAADILGNLWILGIWDSKNDKHLPSLYKDERQEQRPLGWGVLVLPLKDFKEVATPQIALGAAYPHKTIVKDARANSIIDISDTIDAVRDASIWHPDWGYDILGPPGSDGETPEATTEVTEGALSTITGLVLEEDDDTLEDNPEVTEERELESPPDMTLYQTTPYWQQELFEMPTLLANNCAILRTYKTDIELQPPSRLMNRTICKDIVKQRFRLPANPTFPLQHVERLNMLASIPELSLVVVGSQAGRAALISLTRVPLQAPEVMFRIDLILPFKSQEDEGLRPLVPLLGMATSPLPMDMTGKSKLGVKAWRLILHYYDHTILSYELSRDEETNGLVVI